MDALNDVNYRLESRSIFRNTAAALGSDRNNKAP
jgi:hypothetical protein